MGVNDDDTLCLWTENPSLGVDYSELLKIHADGSVDVLASEDDAAFGPNATHSVVGANWSTTKYINVRGRTIFGAKGTYPVDGPDVQLYVASFDTLAVRGVPLADIIAAETALCDVDPADLDVTDCTEEVMGYAVARVATTRANLEPLLTANRRDVVESEWQLKFPQRGSAPILTIPYEDLGAEEAEISQAEPLATTRAQELDLPRTVLVNYINAGQDYQGGTEPSRRLITRAQKELAVDVAVVMTPDQAAQVADAIMYDTWTARTARSISVLRKYSEIESGDVFNAIDRAGNTLRLRAVEAEYAGPVIKLNTVEDDPTVNTQTSAGAVVGVPQTASGLPPATFADFLDIPVLQGADDNAGMYVALRGTRPTDWQGAVFSRESEDGSLSNVGTVRNSATVGVTEEALPDWTGGNVFDETSSVLITLYSGELESVSREAVLDGTLNALLIGSEIVQACDMTFVSGDTWRVSRMLRGRRGTEWAQTGHAVGERVVLLGFAGMLRPVLTPAELNIEQPYAVQSIGRTTITRYSATNTGVGLKPFAVVDLRRDGDAFEWHRRTRLQHRFLTPDINPLLGEQSEAYDVVLTNSGGTVLESATVSVPAWDPATALSAGDVLTVYQRSASVGRGYPTSLTV